MTDMTEPTRINDRYRLVDRIARGWHGRRLACPR